MSIAELFTAFEDHDLQRLQKLTSSIKTFDRRHSLRPAITRDRSAPRLDHQLLLQLSIRNFDTSNLRPTETSIQTQTVVFVDEGNMSDKSLIEPQEGRDKEVSSESPSGSDNEIERSLTESGQNEQLEGHQVSPEQDVPKPRRKSSYKEMLDLSPDKNCTRKPSMQRETRLSNDDNLSDDITPEMAGVTEECLETDREANNTDDSTDTVINQTPSGESPSHTGDLSPVREEPPPLDSVGSSDDSDWDIFEEFAAANAITHSH